MARKGEVRDVPLPVRFSRGEHETVKEAAAREHEYVSSFIRRTVMAAAERRLAGEEMARR
jgi:uncharacterized protein (DUF1778 family)